MIGFGVPALFLSLLPLWSNFDGCSQAGHWFGYDYGADMMRPMDKNAVYFGGSDPGRFVPTYMAFVESQQPDRWKADWSVYPDETAKRGSAFDRRDVTVITQNALCDTYYANYIRDQYDPRFRPEDVDALREMAGPRQGLSGEAGHLRERRRTGRRAGTSTSTGPTSPRACKQRRPGHARRAPTMSSKSTASWRKRSSRKTRRTTPFTSSKACRSRGCIPTCCPSGLIFKLNPEPLDRRCPPPPSSEDRKFWDAYSQKLLSDPTFRIDSDAILTFGKLAFWHADLYRWRQHGQGAGILAANGPALFARNCRMR